MSETIINIFNVDEQVVLSEINKEILEAIQKLPVELAVDNERMGEVSDE